MEVWVNAATGFRDNSFMPYIDYQNEGKAPPPYSPNTSPYNYGLYNTAQPACGTWLNNLNQFQELQEGVLPQMRSCGVNGCYSNSKAIPAAIIDKTGRIHSFPPYINGGYGQTVQNTYQPLLRNASQLGNQNY